MPEEFGILLINDAPHNQSLPSSPIVALNDDVTQVEDNNEPESANNSSDAIDSEAAPGKNSSSFFRNDARGNNKRTLIYPSCIIMPGVCCPSSII